jgi:Family of unknown function (DUF6789)
MTRTWLIKSIIAGACGSAAHSLLMLAKSWSGLLPSFQPYESLQHVLTHWIGGGVHPAVPWALSFLNGSIVIGSLFGRGYRWIPGKNGLVKGLIIGAFGWMLIGLVFFPWLGLGVFAMGIGLGIAPALFALAMLLAYSVVMGIVYDALEARLPE